MLLLDDLQKEELSFKNKNFILGTERSSALLHVLILKYQMITLFLLHVLRDREVVTQVLCNV